MHLVLKNEAAKMA